MLRDRSARWSAVATRSLRSPVALLAVVSLALLGASAGTGVRLHEQSQRLSERVDVTEGLTAGDVRSISQAQRSLHALELALVSRAPVAEVRARAEDVTRTTHDSAVDDQLSALGSTFMLEVARNNEDFWSDQVREQVMFAAGLRPRSSSATNVALARITELEQSYDMLADAAEKHRREQAVAATRAARAAAGDFDGVIGLWLALFLAGALACVIGCTLLARAGRHRAAIATDLQGVNAELQRYSKMVHGAEIGLLATDRKHRVTWVNEAFERITGWRSEQVLGRVPAEFLEGPETDPDVTPTMLAALSRNESARAEARVYGPDGRAIWASVEVSPLTGDRGEPEGFLAVLNDVTERHEAEALLSAARQAAEESAREKAAFLATMSHEIRTPLNALLGLNDLLMLTDLDQEQHDYVETAHRSGSHLLALVNDVLDYSALEAGRLEYADEPFSLRGLLDETLAMFIPTADAKGLGLRVRVAEDVPSLVRGDAVRLRQVLVNLVGNALKFTDAGSVSVSCDLVPGSTDPARLLLSVADTGIGVPAWRIPELFRSFARGDVSTTREYHGTGLGLAISRRLVEAMGGEICLESTVGEGTVVTVQLVHRRVADGTAVKAPVAPKTLPDHSGRRVLVAEDDPVNQKVVVRMLGRLGVVPTVVANGQGAVDAVLAGDFDTVLMDVEMPVMDGLTAVGLLRASALEQQPWIVALTANALTGDRDRFLAAGMDDYVSKPVTLEALAGALDRAGAASTYRHVLRLGTIKAG